MDALISVKYEGLIKSIRCQDYILKSCLVVLGKIEGCEVLSILGVEDNVEVDFKVKNTDLRGIKLHSYLRDSLKKHFRIDDKSYVINNLNSLLKRGKKLKEIPPCSYKVRWERGALRKYVEIYKRPEYNLFR